MHLFGELDSSQVATDIDFTNMVYSETHLSTSETLYNPLQPDTQYFWRVKAWNNCGEGPYSEVSTFTTVGDTAVFDTNPVVPSALSEMTISSLGPNSAGTYPVEIVGASATVTNSHYVFLNLNPPAPAVGPNLITPTNGMTDTVLTPTFTWEEVSGSQWYTLEVALDSSFNDIVYSTVVLQTTHEKPTPLNGGTLYYWRVTAANTCGVGVPPMVSTFTTEPGDGTPPGDPEYIYYIPINMMGSN